MGAWGTEPWDNDGASDWFADVVDEAFAAKVDAALREGEAEETVAALWLASELCRVYVWPIDGLDTTLDLGIAAASRILAGEDDESYLELWEHDPAVVGRIQGFHDTLAERRNR